MNKVLTLFILFVIPIAGIAQNVGIGTKTPAVSAQLDVSSTSKGLLPPRMTTIQRDAIVNPVAGLIIFNNTTNGIEIKTSSGWITLSTSSADALPTIQIGTQKWMSRNLDVAFYRNGDPIPQVTDPSIWAGLTTGAWCYADNDSTNGNKFGKLYNWYAVNDTRVLAPSGWHIPSDAEWNTLSNTLGGSNIAGGKMKEAGTINWTIPNINGNNNSGFAGLPGGFRNINGFFSSVKDNGIWWSSTESDNINAWFCFLSYLNGDLTRLNDTKVQGFSVRCLRD